MDVGDVGSGAVIVNLAVVASISDSNDVGVFEKSILITFADGHRQTLNFESGAYRDTVWEKLRRGLGLEAIR